MTQIAGIKITDRQQSALKVQELLTEYGCIIKTRPGMHTAGDDTCTETGLIILELTDSAQWNELKTKLDGLAGVQVKEMLFE